MVRILLAEANVGYSNEDEDACYGYDRCEERNGGWTERVDMKSCVQVRKEH